MMRIQCWMKNSCICRNSEFSGVRKSCPYFHVAFSTRRKDDHLDGVLGEPADPGVLLNADKEE